MKKLEKDGAEPEDFIKRQKVEGGEKKRQGYIDGEKPLTEKASESGLWSGTERKFLEDVTMNMIADDSEVMKNTHGQTVSKWDSKKHRYTLMKVDRDGKVMAERKNEAGKKIKKTDKHEDIYKKW